MKGDKTETQPLRSLRNSPGMAEALLEAAPDAMIVVDAKGTLLVVNGQTEHLFGYRREELVGRPLEMLLPIAARAEHTRHVADYLANARTRPMGRGRDFLARREDGTEIAVDVALSPLVTEAGTFVVAAIRDVTATKQIEAQLVASERMASMGLLAASVAHEVNSPLAAALVNLDLTQRDLQGLQGQLPPHLLEQVRDAHEAMNRINVIIQELRTFSRAEDERMGAVDLGQVLDSVLRLAWVQLKARAHLVRRYDGAPRVWGNEARLGQLFLNLVVNAAQSIGEGAPDDNEIRVTAEARADGHVVVDVADTGQGLAAEIRARLFEPFVTSKDKTEGTGLGLAICKRIVTECGGTIAAEDAPDRGTIFRVTLRAASL